MVFVLLESDGDGHSTELVCWVCELFVSCEPFALISEEPVVIEEGLVDVFGGVFTSGYIIWFCGSFAASPFTAAVAHVKPDYAPINKGIIFGVEVCAGGHIFGQSV